MSVKLNSLIVCSLLLSLVYGIESKLRLGVYFESLCPDSRRFITEQLSPTYQRLSDTFDVHLVPFGNSNWNYNPDTKEVTFECQHGPEECHGNKIMSCIISKAGNDTKLSLGFIDCMFRSENWKTPDVSGLECSKQSAVEWPTIRDCATGPYSDILQLEMANRTATLRPMHNWIPWITLDGEHNHNMQTLAESDLEKLICTKLQQGDRPEECRQKALKDAKYESFNFGRYINREGAIEP